jgi:hypothetical protein
MSYGLGGQSKGIATVIFASPTAAALAAKEHHNVLVDKKPMKASRITIFTPLKVC